MSQSLKMRHILVVCTLGLILTFQNCSQTPSQNDEEALSYEAQLPFAYMAKLDTISYMSCSGMNDNQPDPHGYYSIRAGAYNSATGGLSLTTDFREATKHYDPTHRARLLGMSDKNSDSNLSLSIRSKGNYQQTWTEGSLMVGEDIEALLPPLDVPAVAGPLTASQPGQMINYFPGSQAKRLMEGSLRYYNYENSAKLTRDTLNAKDSLLVLGFSNGSDPAESGLRSPVAIVSPPTIASNIVYGTGYYLQFNVPYGYASGEARVLAVSNGVAEIDLTTNQAQGSSWDCNASYQFMVVRPEDRAAGRVACDSTIDHYLNAAEQSALSAIRRVLPVEDWFVDVTRRCIMPKRTGDYCYGAVQNRVIQYNISSCLNGPTSMCPHFVSVCIKR